MPSPSPIQPLSQRYETRDHGNGAMSLGVGDMEFHGRTRPIDQSRFHAEYWIEIRRPHGEEPVHVYRDFETERKALQWILRKAYQRGFGAIRLHGRD